MCCDSERFNLSKLQSIHISLLPALLIGGFPASTTNGWRTKMIRDHKVEIEVGLMKRILAYIEAGLMEKNAYCVWIKAYLFSV